MTFLMTYPNNLEVYTLTREKINFIDVLLFACCLNSKTPTPFGLIRGESENYFLQKNED